MASERTSEVSPFIAMEILEGASEMEDILHLEVGKPDFAPPDRVVETTVESLRDGTTDYTRRANPTYVRGSLRTTSGSTA